MQGSPAAMTLAPMPLRQYSAELVRLGCEQTNRTFGGLEATPASACVIAKFLRFRKQTVRERCHFVVSIAR